MSTAQLRINSSRLFEQLEHLNAINRLPDGSCCRLALTDADREGRDLVVSWMRDCGLEVRIDPIGNIFGVRAGREPGAPVMTGSHIDTVATAGPYDGTYGVLSGLEVIRTLNDAGVVTRRPLAVAVFTNEEGVRFQPDMMGSLVFAGGLALEDALASTAEDGTRLEDELKRIGYAGSAEQAALRPDAFVELHIEQGPVLHEEGGLIGAVDSLQGISWQEVTIRGVSNHAGTTPMRMRRDAGYCAGRIAVFVRELTRLMGGSQVGTVGSIRLVPGLVNVIAREARVTVDLRNTDDQVLDAAERELAQFLETLAQQEQVQIATRRLVRTPSVKFDERIVRTVEAVAQSLGCSGPRRMTSGAGHDAQMMARICPTAMIFVPSVDGISHNPREYTEPAHLELGANVLLHTLERLAND
ncbi:MAG TPA: M20 family metallo-hydrolase [Steroidobacter sp.]